MILIGLTGGIGSGKSTVARELEGMGYAVYDTDSEAKRIMQYNPMVRSQIELLFGSDIYQGDCLNRKEVARQIFSNPDLRDKINGIVHPAVRFDVAEWSRGEGKIGFVESAILFESGLNKLCKAVVCITASEETRIERTILRDHTTKEQVMARMQSQMAETERVRRSDISIENDGRKEISKICLEILEFCRNFAD